MKKTSAFPSVQKVTTASGDIINMHWDKGMSLRDYLAGQILAGYMANPDYMSAAITKAKSNHINAMEFIATDVYSQADAVLKEREKHEE